MRYKNHQRNHPSAPIGKQEIGAQGMDERMDGLGCNPAPVLLVLGLAQFVKLQEEIGDDMCR